MAYDNLKLEKGLYTTGKSFTQDEPSYNGYDFTGQSSTT